MEIDTIMSATMEPRRCPRASLGSPRAATGADGQAAVEIRLAVLEAGRSGRPVATRSAPEPMRTGTMKNTW